MSEAGEVPISDPTADMPPVLVFEDKDRHRVDQVGWTGPWPPPERITVATGPQTAMKAYLDPAEEDYEVQLKAARGIGAVIVEWKREDYSKLAEDSELAKFMIRGARYVPEE